jgi:phage-related protein
MSLPLSSIAIQEKNKLSTDSIFLLCLKLTIPGVTDPVYLVANNADYVWDSITWLAMDFQVDEISQSSSGENPQVALRVSNISRVMEAYIDAYDIYVKNNGYSPILCDFYLINTKAVTADPDCDPEVEYNFELLAPKTDPLWATFTLGAPNPWNQRFPRNRMMRNLCRYKRFKTDARCGYSGSETSCDRTLTQCRAYNNSEHFGGAPGAGQGGIRLA